MKEFSTKKFNLFSRYYFCFNEKQKQTKEKTSDVEKKVRRNLVIKA